MIFCCGSLSTDVNTPLGTVAAILGATTAAVLYERLPWITIAAPYHTSYCCHCETLICDCFAVAGVLPPTAAATRLGATALAATLVNAMLQPYLGWLQLPLLP